MPRVSPEYRHLQREAILDAAEACLARRGIAETRIDDIASEAAFSVGAVYRYFPSKGSIIAALGERHGQRDRAALAELQSAGLPLRERILETLRYFLARPADRVAIDALHPVDGTRDRRTHDQWVRLVAESYRVAQEEGLVRHDLPAEHVARHILLACEGMAALSGVEELAAADDLLESLATVLADGLAPRRP
ncbi:MAG: TetR/AcrR family transcriptional regulator [Thermoflexaceae bacterium]|nr:TetR/AcrR family transcriptional regulator [Thermoflexaceae bacterium]